jgi:hypothetical protein
MISNILSKSSSVCIGGADSGDCDHLDDEGSCGSGRLGGGPGRGGRLTGFLRDILCALHGFVVALDIV